MSFLRLSTSIVIPSPYSLKRTKKLMPNKNIHYIELFFDKIANKEIKDTYCKGEFLYVGTIEHRKGLHLMIEALALNSEKKLNFIVNIVGKVTDNAYYSKLLYRIRELNLQDKIIFHGRVSDNKLRFLYNNAELFIFPSLLEGYGMVLIEAMSFGIPIVAFNNSAIPLTVKHGVNGLLSENKNVRDFSSCIGLIANNSIYRKKLSSGAIESTVNLRNYLDFRNDIKSFVNDLIKN